MSDIKEDNNKNIIERFLKGENSAFEELVLLHSSKAYQIAFGLLSDKQDAEEVVQDAFIKVYKNLINFRGDASFSTWLYRIVTNLSRNKYHWRRRRGSDINISISNNYSYDGESPMDMEIADVKLHPERFLEEKERRSMLLNVLESIPEKFKEVIILRHFDNISYAEIANILGCELGTIKSRLARARESIKLRFKEYENK